MALGFIFSIFELSLYTLQYESIFFFLKACRKAKQTNKQNKQQQQQKNAIRSVEPLWQLILVLSSFFCSIGGGNFIYRL